MNPDMKRAVAAMALYVPEQIADEAVRAVLQALREPSERMVDAAYRYCDQYETPHAEDAWRAMIDEVTGATRMPDYIQVQS